MEFRILQTDTSVDLVEYLKFYLSENPDAQIIIGCDSKNRDSLTIYAVVVVLYKPRRGGHVLYSKKRIPRIKERCNRLWHEVEISVNLANDFVELGLPKPVFIDLDLNPDPRFKSNDVVRAAGDWLNLWDM